MVCRQAGQSHSKQGGRCDDKKRQRSQGRQQAGAMAQAVGKFFMQALRAWAHALARTERTTGKASVTSQPGQIGEEGPGMGTFGLPEGVGLLESDGLVEDVRLFEGVSEGDDVMDGTGYCGDHIKDPNAVVLLIWVAIKVSIAAAVVAPL